MSVQNNEQESPGRKTFHAESMPPPPPPAETARGAEMKNF